MKTWDDVMREICERAAKGKGSALVVANGPHALDMMAMRAPEALVRGMHQKLHFPTGYIVRLKRHRHGTDLMRLRGVRADIAFVAKGVPGGMEFARLMLMALPRDASPVAFEE